MTLGLTPGQGDLLRTTASFCGDRVAKDSTDEMFADLFTNVGRRSVPPLIVAVVMVLQRIEGCSDREAVDRFTFDTRWKYAAGGLSFDYPGFVHTVLVDMRARLAASAAPDRIFEVTLQAAKSAGLVGRKRVLDSTPLYDAVATMDTVTLLRSGIRGLLRVADAELEARLRAVFTRDDDYANPGKPVCAWDDAAARKELVDALAKDGHAALDVLEGLEPPTPVLQAGELLATLLGQDLDCVQGVFHIARRVAKDRVISTVDPEARHGHKTSARGFDGYKGHVAIDPDSKDHHRDRCHRREHRGCGTRQGVARRRADHRDVKERAAHGRCRGRGRRFAAGRRGCRQWRRGRGTRAPVRVWGCRLRRRCVAGGPGGSRGSGDGQGPAAGGPGRALSQGPLPHRPRGRNGDLPGEKHRVDPSGQGRRRHRILRCRMRDLPVGCGLHHREVRAEHHHQPLRGRTGPGPNLAAGAGMAGRVPGHPPEGRTQDRAFDAAQTRRTARQGPR